MGFGFVFTFPSLPTHRPNSEVYFLPLSLEYLAIVHVGSHLPFCPSAYIGTYCHYCHYSLTLQIKPVYEPVYLTVMRRHFICLLLKMGPFEQELDWDLDVNPGTLKSQPCIDLSLTLSFFLCFLLTILTSCFFLSFSFILSSLFLVELNLTSFLNILKPHRCYLSLISEPRLSIKKKEAKTDP